jgi:hypothetical protein
MELYLHYLILHGVIIKHRIHLHSMVLSEVEGQLYLYLSSDTKLVSPIQWLKKEVNINSLAVDYLLVLRFFPLLHPLCFVKGNIKVVSVPKHHVIKVYRVVKVKALCLTKHHAMKTYWGNEGIVPRILDLGTRWRWVVSFTPRQL